METAAVRPVLTHSTEPSSSLASIRIAIIEDMQCVADLFVFLCERQWGHTVVAVERTAACGYDALLRTRPDVVLLDLGLPDFDGITLAHKLNEALPSARIIVVSSLCNDYYLHRLRRVRIKGFIDKFGDGLSSLQQAIDQVYTGGTYFSPRFLTESQRLSKSQTSFFKLLSERELEVLLWIAQSLNDQEIAELLAISAATVQTHRREIMRKLGIHSAPKLMRYGWEHGMLSKIPSFANLQLAQQAQA